VGTALVLQDLLEENVRNDCLLEDDKGAGGRNVGRNLRCWIGRIVFGLGIGMELEEVVNWGIVELSRMKSEDV
jgi:hypothetical protein